MRGATVAPLSGRLRTEPVGSFPGEIGATSRRDIDTGFEPGELSGPIRKRTHSVKGRIECATADRPVAKPGIEDDVTVQIKTRRDTRRLVIEDLRADQDLLEVRGCECAEAAWGPRVLRAFLRHMELAVLRGCRDRSRSRA